MVQKLKLVSVVTLSCLIASGCGGNKKNEPSYNLQTESIFANGCLNLQNFYSSLRAMPADGVVRAVTTDFSAADKDTEGKSPSSARLRVLTRASYIFSESSPSEIQTSWSGASQADCGSGALIDSYGNATPFTVEDISDNSITVQLSDESTHRFILTSERSMRILSSDFRGSQCIGDAPIRAQTETVLRWGPSNELPTGEIVSAGYMKALSAAVPEAPAALRASVSEVTTDSLSLSTAVLAEMNGMKVSAADQSCPKTNKAPEAPPLPTPTPTPEPQPTPVPEPTPEPTPTEEPAPAPTPEI